MGHEDDGGSRFRQPTNRFEQAIRFGIGQHRGRLVENKDSHAADQHLHDLDLLLFRHSQRIGPPFRVDVESEFFRLRLDGLANLLDARTKVSPAIGEQDVFRDRERLYQLEVLVDHTDAVLARIGWSAQRNRSAINGDRSDVWRIEAGGNIHQRRFTRAVLAEKRMHLTGAGPEHRVIQSHDPIEGFTDPGEFERKAHERRALMIIFA